MFIIYCRILRSLKHFCPIKRVKDLKMGFIPKITPFPFFYIYFHVPGLRCVLSKNVFSTTNGNN